MTHPTELDEQIVHAIRAHMSWRVQIQDAVVRRTPLSPLEASDHHACELGRWVDALRADLGHTREWLQLNAQHEVFHRHVRTCVDMTAAGQEDAALAWISSSAHSRSSVQMLDALLRLRDHLRNHPLQTPTAHTPADTPALPAK